jgi:hypothetical protein
MRPPPKAHKPRLTNRQGDLQGGRGLKTAMNPTSLAGFNGTLFPLQDAMDGTTRTWADRDVKCHIGKGHVLANHFRVHRLKCILLVVRSVLAVALPPSPPCRGPV